MARKLKRVIKVIFLLGILVTVVWLYLADFSQGQKIEYGITFSQKYASELKLNWPKLYLAILNNLQVKKLRLIAYWDLIEKNKGEFDFRDLDWQVREASRNQAQVVLAIGQRLPRWPECHSPQWTAALSEAERGEGLLKFITTVVKHYQTDFTIIAWQLENEPFLRVFGQCPQLNKAFYKREVDLVRSLDKRPIIVTESGELSTWLRAAKLADYIGTSVYRITWNKYWGYFYYPLPPAYYYLKTQLIKLLTPVKGVIVSEMQMEPWLGKPVIGTPLAEQYHSMNVKRLQKNFHYIQRAGLSPVYLWGVEWWYWLKEQGDESIWNLAKQWMAQ